MLLRIRLFKCLDFKTFDFVVIYNIVAKNFIYIYKIVLGAGRDGSPWDPKGQGWGNVICPAPQGGEGMGKGNNHVGRGRRSHPSAPPCPIAIPNVGGSTSTRSICISLLSFNLFNKDRFVENARDHRAHNLIILISL